MKRREWPVWFDGSLKHITSFPPANAPAKPDVIVREVLPGDTVTIDMDWNEHLQRHAALVEAAKAVDDDATDFENDEDWMAVQVNVLLDLRKAIIACEEASDE